MGEPKQKDRRVSLDVNLPIILEINLGFPQERAQRSIPGIGKCKPSLFFLFFLFFCAFY